jgi:cobalt-zinc-cadmium resistance protein CzcA
VKYQQALVNTAYNFAPTQINAELGQFNSTYFDTGLGFSQTFSLPKVYQRRAAAYQQQVKTAEYYLKLSETEIRQQLDQIFMEYNYLAAKENLLKNQDSLYNAFVQKSLLRWQKGETDILEKTTAEQQKLNISNQLSMIGRMKEYVVLQLQWYLNDGRKYVPQTDGFGVLKYGIFYDSLSLNKHPVLQMAAQEIATARAMTQAEKTALWPELSAGYRNVSIRGTGADNVVYQGGDRFSSFQVGVGIPIFQKGIRASIHSAQMMEEVKANMYEARKSEISAQIQEKYVLYNANMAQLEQYEKSALPNARLIRSVSEQQFGSGQINYLEYVMLTNQAINIESEYLELKRNLNAYIIELHYLTGNF